MIVSLPACEPVSLPNGFLNQCLGWLVALDLVLLDCLLVLALLWHHLVGMDQDQGLDQEALMIGCR